MLWFLSFLQHQSFFLPPLHHDFSTSMSLCLSYFPFLSDIFSTPLFSLSPLLSPSPVIHPIIISHPVIIQFFLSLLPLFSSASLTPLLLLNPPIYPSFLTLLLLYNFPSRSRLLFPLHPAFSLGSTSSSIHQYAHHPPQPCHRNMIFTRALSSALIDLSRPIPTCLFPFLLLLLILIIIHQYLLISSVKISFLLPPPLPFPPQLSVIVSCFDIFPILIS